MRHVRDGILIDMRSFSKCECGMKEEEEEEESFGERCGRLTRLLAEVEFDNDAKTEVTIGTTPASFLPPTFFLAPAFQHHGFRLIRQSRCRRRGHHERLCALPAGPRARSQ